MSWHQIQKIFPEQLNICIKFEEIPSISKDAIGRQTCGVGGPFCENSSHMQTSIPRGTLNNVNRNSLGLSNCCQSNHNISQSQVRIHQAWSVSEGDICEWLLDYILVIFVVICVYYTCYHLIFDFPICFTLATPKSEMFVVWSQMSDANIDK